MCQAAGRAFADYYRLKATKAFLLELESDMGIPMSELAQQLRGGVPELQSTWVHPLVATHLVQWLSPKFAVQVNKWVYGWLSGQAAQHAPTHVRRYAINQHKVPLTHFSMLNQMIFRLLGPLEAHGYILRADLMPDIALGLMFSKWLRDKGYDPASFPSYNHDFPEGDRRPTVQARLYPNRLITEFNEQLDDWLRT